MHLLSTIALYVIVILILSCLVAFRIIANDFSCHSRMTRHPRTTRWFWFRNASTPYVRYSEDLKLRDVRWDFIRQMSSKLFYYNFPIIVCLFLLWYYLVKFSLLYRHSIELWIWILFYRVTFGWIYCFSPIFFFFFLYIFIY